MEISRRTKYMLIGLLVILNIILRLPVTPHELGSDSFQMHAWASSISANGYANWILHPLSFFGLYPFSYASGELFLLSELSQCTGLEMEWTVWLAATFFGVFGIFTSYLMAKEIRNDFLFAFSVAFVFSISRIFISVTNWTVTTRGLFVTLLPLLIWSLLRSYTQKEERLKYLLLTACLLILLATIHQMIFLTPLILIAFGISILLYSGSKSKKFKAAKITPKVSIILFFALFIPLFLLPFTPLGFYHRLELFEGGRYYGFFSHGSTHYHILLNIGATYAVAVGIAIILIPIGAFTMLLEKQKMFGEIFLVVLMLCFAPFLAEPTYIKVFVLFICALLIGFGLLGIQKMLGKVKRVKSAAPLIIIALLAFSALTPYFVVVRPQTSLPLHTTHMNELTYSTALFIKAYGVEIPRISNTYVPERINAIAGYPYYGDKSKWSSRIKPIAITEFLEARGKYDYLYKVERSRSERFHWTWDCDSDQTNRVLNYKPHLVIEDNYRPNISPFQLSLHETRPKIYDNGLDSIWYLSY